jgi:LPXTG-motif cell wall-anchored protein
MNRLLFVGATALGTCLGICTMLAVSAPAWAQVVVSPEVVTAGDYETLTVSVPTEKEVPTTEIRVEVPEGFLLSGVQPAPGWEHTLQEDGGVVTAVTFSGGEIRPQEFQQFLVQVQAPEEAGKYPWKAFQTYEDGSVVEWTGTPESEEPAPVVEVVSGGSEQSQSTPKPSEASASQKEASSDAAGLPETGGTNPAVYAGLGFVGLVVSALLARRLLG